MSFETVVSLRDSATAAVAQSESIVMYPPAFVMQLPDVSKTNACGGAGGSGGATGGMAER